MNNTSVNNNATINNSSNVNTVATSTLETSGNKKRRILKLPKLTFKIWPHVNIFNVTHWFVLALLVAREFVPGVADQIPAVYDFLDSVVLPIVNWAYAIVMKIIEWLMSWPLVESILDWLSSLAH